MSFFNRLHQKNYFVAAIKSLHFAVLFLAICRSSAPAQDAPPVTASLMAANDLIRRVLPQQADRFSVELTPAADGLDVFEIEAKAERIVLRGNSGLSIAMAFNWYLRYEAKVNFDWQAAGPLEFRVRCRNPRIRSAGNAPPRNGSSLTIALIVIPCRGGNGTNGSEVELKLTKATRINHVILMEQISEGERIRKYVVEGMVDGIWKELAKGTCIGHKHIAQFSDAEVSRVRLRVTHSVGQPMIRRLAVYHVTSRPA